MSANSSTGKGMENKNGRSSESAENDDVKSNEPGKVTNPLFFPERFLNSGLRAHGVIVPKFPVSNDPLTHLENIMALPMRSADVVIAAYLKCGTHWMSDILYMLTRGCVSYKEKTKENEMFEYVDDLPSLDGLQSPRILNSHLYIRVLPREILEKRIKIIHLIRNPKDVAVSLYHHLKQYATSQFNFELFLQGYMTEHYLSVSHQLNYLKQMSEFCSAHPDHPIKTIAYEELKQDAVAVIRDLAQFLELPVNEQLFQEIASACTFEKLKSKDATRSLPKNVQGTVPGKKSLNLYRKGVIGDWKNHFTVAQSETFDEFMRHRETACGDFTFKWA